MSPDSLPLRLTIREVAELARRDVSTVYKDVKHKDLRAETTGNHKRGMTVAREDALAYAKLARAHDDEEGWTEAEWEAMSDAERHEVLAHFRAGRRRA